MTGRSREHRGAGADPCRALRDALLGAEPAELRGEAGTPLGRHLAQCARCRRAADRILTASSELDGWLRAPGRGPDLDAILGSADPPARRWRPSARWAPAVALAAAVAGLLLLRIGPGGPSDAYSPGGRPVASRASPPLDLDVPAGRSAAVITTGDPDITVIWFLGADP